MRYTPDERQAHLDLWRESGLSRAAYCRKAGLTYQTFVNWVRREQSHGLDAESTDSPDGFVQLWSGHGRMARDRHSDGDLRIELCGSGLSLLVEQSVDDSILLRAIRSLAAC